MEQVNESKVSRDSNTFEDHFKILHNQKKIKSEAQKSKEHCQTLSDCPYYAKEQ